MEPVRFPFTSSMRMLPPIVLTLPSASQSCTVTEPPIVARSIVPFTRAMSMPPPIVEPSSSPEMPSILTPPPIDSISTSMRSGALMTRRILTSHLQRFEQREWISRRRTPGSKSTRASSASSSEQQREESPTSRSVTPISRPSRLRDTGGEPPAARMRWYIAIAVAKTITINTAISGLISSGKNMPSS